VPTRPRHRSDYHPDGGQLFFPVVDGGLPFVVCLGPASKGDDIKPTDMRAFAVPQGVGVYLEPGTWHNGVYALPDHCPARFITRQGRVHARVSCSWVNEFNTVLRIPFSHEN
jgi:ureidoglycolate lyase